MDLLKYKFLEEGADLHLIDPDTKTALMDGDTPVTVRLISRESSQWLKVQDDATKQKASAIRNSETKPSLEELYDLSLDAYALAVIGWTGLSLGTEPFEYSKENAQRLVREFPWVRKQIQDFWNDEGNFIKDCSTA